MYPSLYSKCFCKTLQNIFQKMTPSDDPIYIKSQVQNISTIFEVYDNFVLNIAVRGYSPRGPSMMSNPRNQFVNMQPHGHEQTVHAQNATHYMRDMQQASGKLVLKPMKVNNINIIISGIKFSGIFDF